MVAASVLATLGPGQNATVLISTTPNVCFEYHDDDIKAGAQYLQLQVPGVDFNSTATYPISSADFIQYDAACVVTSDLNPLSGTLTLTSASLTTGGSVSGSFSLVFGAGMLSGTFDAPYCLLDFSQQVECH